MPSIQTSNTNNNYMNSNQILQAKKSDESVSIMSDQTPRRNELVGPIYEVQHLATFTVGSKHGLLRADDGMRKLRLMEHSQFGIWTMDCEIMIDKKYLVILDKKSGQEVEIVPLNLIHDPTSVINDDKKDIYNNILLFTVLEDPKKKSSSQSEMHIFQCLKNHSTEIVDEILRAKEMLNGNIFDKKILDGRSQVKNSGMTQADDNFELHRNNLMNVTDSNNNGNNNYNQYRVNINNGSNPASNRNISEKLHNNENHRQAFLQNTVTTASYTPYSESIDQDVQILNHCFDDIERFVTRLQNSSDYFKELERRKNQRKSRKKQIGDGLLGMRAQMPPPQHFYDIFQKFKLSFNLLAKLKAHIHDPNAPELIHFLFTPLTLIINASKDLQSNRGLTKTVWSPLLTKSAKELLLNCLTSKEQDLWQSLGESWTISKEEAKVHPNYQYVEPYNPIFYDGWAPNLEQSDTRSEISRIAFVATGQQITNTTSQYHNPKPLQKTQVQQYISSKPNLTNSNNTNKENEIREWANNLVSKGSKICEVLTDRQGNNDKELSVKASELVEIIDDRRNWWRVKNFYGQTGHVPNTILKAYDGKNNQIINANDINGGFQNLDVEKNGYF